VPCLGRRCLKWSGHGVCLCRGPGLSQIVTETSLLNQAQYVMMLFENNLTCQSNEENKVKNPSYFPLLEFHNMDPETRYEWGTVVRPRHLREPRSSTAPYLPKLGSQ
jgi:hypothetical protein